MIAAEEMKSLEFLYFFPANRLISICLCFVLSQKRKSKLLESGSSVLTQALCILFKLDQIAYLCSTEQHTVHKSVDYYRESL